MASPALLGSTWKVLSPALRVSLALSLAARARRRVLSAEWGDMPPTGTPATDEFAGMCRPRNQAMPRYPASRTTTATPKRSADEPLSLKGELPSLQCLVAASVVHQRICGVLVARQGDYFAEDDTVVSRGVNRRGAQLDRGQGVLQ